MVRPFRVLELIATLRVGTEDWWGAGVWELDGESGINPSLPDQIATAYRESARVLMSPFGPVKFQITGEVTEAKGVRALSLRRMMDNIPADDPRRVTWKPVLKVNGVQANGEG